MTRRQLREQERAAEAVLKAELPHTNDMQQPEFSGVCHSDVSVFLTRRERREAEKSVPGRSRNNAGSLPNSRSRANTPHHSRRRESFLTQTSRFFSHPHSTSNFTSQFGSTGEKSHRRRSRASKGLTFTAMTLVGGLMVATSVPANALLSSEDVQAMSYVGGVWTHSTETQSLASKKNTTGHATERDGYGTSSISEIAASTGIRMESGTFTNDPRGTIQWPFTVGVHIGDHFGYRDCAGCSTNHGGQDFNPGNGAPVQAISDAVVRYVEDGESSLGVHVILDHQINGKLVSSVYAHMQHGSVKVREGEHVNVGQVIGKVGTTGMSTGPHLHFEIRLNGTTKVDPLEWLYNNVN